MNARTIVLFCTLAIVTLVGFTWLGKDTETANPISTSLSKPVAGAVESPPAVYPVGIMINSPTHTGADPESDDTFAVDLAFYGTFEKTRLALELVFPKGGIIELKNEESELTVFEDDKGTDLRKTDQFFGPFEMMPRVAEDGRHLVFVAGSDKLPYPTASKLAAKGKVAVLVADQAESFKVENVKVAEGTTFSVAGFDFEIREVGASEWGEGYSLTLVTKTDPGPIVSYGMIDGEGQSIELRPTMSMSGGGSWQQTLDYDRPVEVAAFVVEAWQDPELLSIPFEVSAGLGLR